MSEKFGSCCVQKWKKKEKKKWFPCKITKLGFNDFVFYSKSGE